MSIGLYCPECGEYFGKDIECSKNMQCGNCGHSFINPRGDDNDDDEL